LAKNAVDGQRQPQTRRPHRRLLDSVSTGDRECFANGAPSLVDRHFGVGPGNGTQIRDHDSAKGARPTTWDWSCSSQSGSNNGLYS
jgi:hypothetical protein